MKTHRNICRIMLPLAGLLLWLPLAAGCKKNGVDALPPATQTGANTLGCKVNGKSWVAQDSDEIFNPAFGVEGGYEFAYIDTIRNNIWIQARRNDRTFLHLFVRQVNKPGVYPLNLSTGAAPGAIVPYSYGLYYGSPGEYMTGPGHTGSVTVTRADTINKIIAGTFEFTGYDPQTRQAISITEGRFDVKTR